MKILFRDHRGGLIESMKTVREIKKLSDINNSKCLKIKHYCFDERINWNTYIVTNEHGVVGFTNGLTK